MLDIIQSNSQYTDFQGDIVGNPERGIRFTLTYVSEYDRFYSTIDDTDNTGFYEVLEDVPHNVAKFMIGKEQYKKLKSSIKDEEFYNKMHGIKKMPKITK
jgi:chemotaxis methyl-accepting protein methylase